ncbi:MAG: hypothetical protein B7X82_14515 [Hydrogenophilales bacterium 17-64-65]|nr:MAG: hypothetical protein B7X82_14515 [Hydrogenophilales bacterium 17-64-65]
MMWAWLPSASELRKALQGASVGARLALGPQRWSELRPTFVVAVVCVSVLASMGLVYLAYLFVEFGMAWGFEWFRNN